MADRLTAEVALFMPDAPSLEWKAHGNPWLGCRLLLNLTLWSLWLPDDVRGRCQQFRRKKEWLHPDGGRMRLRLASGVEWDASMQVLEMRLPDSFVLEAIIGASNAQMRFRFDPVADSCAVELQGFDAADPLPGWLRVHLIPFVADEVADTNACGECWREYVRRVETILDQFEFLMMAWSGHTQTDHMDNGYSDAMSPVEPALWTAEDAACDVSGEQSIHAIDRSYGPTQRWLDKLSEQSYWAMPAWSKAWFPEQVQALAPREEWKHGNQPT